MTEKIDNNRETRKSVSNTTADGMRLMLLIRHHTRRVKGTTHSDCLQADCYRRGLLTGKPVQSAMSTLLTISLTARKFPRLLLYLPPTLLVEAELAATLETTNNKHLKLFTV